VRLLRFGITVEVAKQTLAILGSPIREVSDERFDLISGGIPECGGTAVVDGISLHEVGVEPVLADQKAEAVA